MKRWKDRYGKMDRLLDGWMGVGMEGRLKGWQDGRVGGWKVGVH